MSSEYTLSDYVSLIRGTTYKGDLVNLPGPVLLGLASIQSDGGFRWGAFKTYGGECPAKITLKSGDLYVSLKDVTQSGDLLGSVARIPKQIESGRLTQDTVKLELSGRAINPSYLYWMLRTPQYREYCRSRATGTTTLGLAREDFLAFPIADPKPEQDSLVELLEGIEERIELLAETNATLEAIAQALFKSWFVDFDPVHANAGTQNPSLPPEIQALFPATFTDAPQGPIPEGWKVGTVGDVIETLGGATPDTKNEEFWYPAEIAWTSPKDLSGLNTPVLLATERRVSQKGLTKISSGLLPKGTLLMSSRAPIGYLAIAQIPLAINQGYIAMPPGGYFPPLYMLFWCRTNMELIENRANGSTFMEISKKAFKPIELIVPPIEIIDQFMSSVTPLFEKLIENEQQAQNLESLRDTLLPRLISGQLRLPEVKTTLAEVV